MRKKVALIFGGRSLERDISVITAMQAYNNIDRTLFNIEPIFMFDGDFYVRGLDKMQAFVNFDPSVHAKAVLYRGEFYTLKRNGMSKYFKPDAVLVCCHGGEGENGILQALLEYNGLPYTSSGVLASAAGMDKALSKQLFDAMLLNTLPHETVTREEYEDDKEKIVAQLESYLCYPMIVKPSAQGSSIGIGVANDSDELVYALDVASRFDDKIIVEQKLTDFCEVNCAAFRDGSEIIVSETEQPLTLNDFLTFEDKYTDGGKMSGGGHIIPADIGSLELIIKANTERVYRELDLRGVVRMDYLVDKTRNKVYINEINTIPGSLAFYLFEPIGITFKELLSRLIYNSADNGAAVRRTKAFRTDVLSRFNGAKSGGRLK